MRGSPLDLAKDPDYQGLVQEMMAKIWKIIGETKEGIPLMS